MKMIFDSKLDKIVSVQDEISVYETIIDLCEGTLSNMPHSLKV